MEDAGQQRLVVAAEIGVAVDGGAAEMRAVIALLQRDELGALRLAVDLVELAGKAQRCLHRIRAARGEEGAREPVLLEEFGKLVGKLDQRRIGRAAEGGVIGQLLELVADRLLHRLAGIAEIDVPEPADGIQHLLAMDIHHLDALAGIDDARGLGLHLGGMGHGVPEMAGVVLDQEIGIAHGISFQIPSIFSACA